MAKVKFFVQFERKYGTVSATKLTQARGATPRGSGAIRVAFVADVPDWLFDPLDLIAKPVDVPADHAEPIIRLESVGPVLPTAESEPA
jgi:hypothetical protein